MLVKHIEPMSKLLDRAEALLAEADEPFPPGESFSRCKSGMETVSIVRAELARRSRARDGAIDRALFAGSHNVQQAGPINDRRPVDPRLRLASRYFTACRAVYDPIMRGADGVAPLLAEVGL